MATWLLAVVAIVKVRDDSARSKTMITDQRSVVINNCSQVAGCQTTSGVDRDESDLSLFDYHQAGIHVPPSYVA